MIVLVRLVTDPIVFVAIIGLFAAPITGVVTWYLNRGRDKVDRASSLISASGEAVDAIRDVMVALQNDLNKTKAELDLLKFNCEEMKVLNGSLLETNRELLGSIDALRGELREGLEKHRDQPDEFWRTVSRMVDDVE